ncbi:ABC transporter ATP-binding protein [Paenibacillus jiagnxiensis]|uniref:ABC transporter ATP-binding protein n=1 Tax=Paenibacillus jiagnxiensis TaxID=3228926 RepID=UPI0033AE8053
MSEQPIREQPLLQVEQLTKYFAAKSGSFWRKKQVKAVQDVSFSIYEGETYGLVGESGSGKSTAGRTLLRLTEPTSGRACFQNQDIFTLRGKEIKALRREVQMIFQDPLSSLDPNKRVGYSIAEPLAIHGQGSRHERHERVLELLGRVGLTARHADRFPHEFSGGQRQRIGIAKALALQPKLMICDEPVSALDVSIQSQILNLLIELQTEYRLSYLFISHDLSVVRHIADRIGVMYLGHLVEQAPTDELFARPLHPYTQFLLSAIPAPHPKLKRERILLQGDIPSPANPPSGCVFHTRCPYVMDVCKQVKPAAMELSPGHRVQCHLYHDELKAETILN